ncbi:MAG: tRNA-(ms2io6A)-hydroxylase [Gammaproteobacteria bacterium]|nr:MAG: tRNA-(ms2io6A)-hydroxylase [Gammaproteobacteria bacterium]TND06634.1 MAG: tRNA-(ms2io6A)-hydroxylase [Gammaproteobacteria bacterium]
MAKKSIDLYVRTAPEWVATILNNFDEFLADHANCERKASALAMSLVVKYPDRTGIIPRLIELAQEELEHFRQVYELMLSRGVAAIPDTRDPYVNKLLALRRHGRDEGFLDQLLLASIIECRGAERFRLISEALQDTHLKHFYRDLWTAEAKHGHVFVDMALECFDEKTVYDRLHEIARAEAEILGSLEWRPSLH